MWTVRTSVLALILLAACDGNPLASGGGSDDGGVDACPTDTSASCLPGTANPSAASSITRYEAKVETSGEDFGNGYAEGFVYDAGPTASPDDDTFTVDGLAFDGDNVYQRDDVVPSLAGAKVFEADATAVDPVTSAVIDQFTHRALYGVSTSGRSRFAIVRTAAYLPFGFGGFIYSRDGGVELPTGGMADYSGAYAGLRDFNGKSGLEYVTGDMTLSIDFDAFNTGDTSTGDAIKAQVFNRRVFDLDGNDITTQIRDEINDDKSASLTELPTLVFNVGPENMDANGEIEGDLGSVIATSTGTETLESGKFYAVISGTGADQEVVGVIVVKSTVNDITVRETGGFILYR